MSLSYTPRPVGRWRRLVQHLGHYLPDVAAFGAALLCAGLAALLAALLSGCGGGVGSEGTGSGAIASFSSGPISGFGSIIVNGVHFDESAAQVQDDDGASLLRSQLALGMVVQVSGGPISTSAAGTATAVATSVRTSRSLVGPVSALNATAGQLSVLGQRVKVSADTVLDERLSGGLAGLRVNQLLEVYAAYDSSCSCYLATRIAPASATTAYRVSGPVSSVDAQARSFTLGSQTYSLAAVSSGTPAVDSEVRLNVQASPDQDGRWVVSQSRSGDSPPSDSNSDGASLDGVVSALLSGSRFTLNGVTVSYGGAQLSGNLAAGVQVAVKGTLRSGVLVASQVAVVGGQARSYELNGSLSGLDTANRRFVVRGTTVSYARSDLQFDNGSAARLVGYTGQLEVTGVLSADRTVLDATRIQFKN